MTVRICPRPRPRGLSNADLDISAEQGKEDHQLLDREAAQLVVRERGHLGLRDAKQARDFGLLEVPALDDAVDVDGELNLGGKDAGVLEAEIGENVVSASSDLFHDPPHLLPWRLL